jgi:hypothetical protein
MNAVRKLALIGLVCGSVPAFATQGSATNAKVTGVDVRVGGVFLVAFTPAPSGPPICATATDFRMTGNSTTADGKVLLAAVLTAYATGAPIALIQGTGACTEYPNHESLAILSQGVE